MKVSEWCDLWGMKLNSSKTKTMIVSRSRTMHPQSPALTIGWTVLKESDTLRKSWQVSHDRLLLARCFRGFALPVLEYCPAVWCSAANAHLRLLNRVVSGASFLTGGVFECDLAHRRSVAVRILYALWCSLWSSCAVCAGADYTRHCDRTSVHLCASSLPNLAVLPDFYSLVSISVERS